MGQGVGKFGAVLVVLACAGVVAAQTPPSSGPTLLPDGIVRVPAFEMPPSPFLSEEGRALQNGIAARLSGSAPPPPSMQAMSPRVAAMPPFRQAAEAFFAPRAEALLAIYPAHVEELRIGGVRTRVITPSGVPVDPARVLMNAHGGGFNSCSEACGLIESLPIAALSGFKVITIDYRMAPEFVHPAAIEDVVAVYRELIRTYRPDQIGMFGCSAGGVLSAQVAAWLPAHGLPQLGAIGIFGAGAVAQGGDSTHIGAMLDGFFRVPAASSAPSRAQPAPMRSYFEGTDPADPMVRPGLDRSVMSLFPPTLTITGTRAVDMSPALVTHSTLLDVNVPSQLIVAEGLGHCYIYEYQLPEAQAAYRQIARFFQAHLE